MFQLPFFPPQCPDLLGRRKSAATFTACSKKAEDRKQKTEDSKNTGAQEGERQKTDDRRQTTYALP